MILPASVVPLDMDEVRDSVVLGRFNAVSSLVMGFAEDGPEGLGGGTKKIKIRRQKTSLKQEVEERGEWIFIHFTPTKSPEMLISLTTAAFKLQNDRCEVRHSLYAVFGRSVALVKLISVIKLILAGRVGEIWHRVWGQRDVSWRGNSTAGA